MNGVAQLIMSQNECTRIVGLQLTEQVEQGTFLCIRTRIGRLSPLIESALVADADALVVPARGMGADLVGGAADMDFTVAGDVEVVADAGKAALQMTAPQGFHRKITVVARCTTMNYQEADLPVVLIETSVLHRVSSCKT